MILAQIGFGIIIFLAFEAVFFKLFLIPFPATNNQDIRVAFKAINNTLLVCGTATSIMLTILIVKDF